MGMNVHHIQIGSTLFGKTRLSILALLYGKVDRQFYLSEIVRAVGGGRGAVQRELKRLTDAGLLRRAVRGNQVYFQANSDCPVFADLKGLIVKTAGVVDVLRAALAPLGKRIHVAFIYGSIVRGEETADSDVDLLIVGEVTLFDVVSALASAQEMLRREVNPSIYPAEEVREKVDDGDHFFTTVMASPKLFVIGDEDKLGRLAG